MVQSEILNLETLGDRLADFLGIKYNDTPKFVIV